MADCLREMRDQLDVFLHDSSKPWTSTLALAEEKTGVNRLYLFAGLVAVIGLWLVVGYAAQLVCNSLGFLYPAYASTHAIETKEKDDDTRWLTYWVVFALFSVVEFFADIFAWWFPLYWLIKFLFLIWLMMPTEINGSLIIYHRIIRPHFLRCHGEMSASQNKAKEPVSLSDNTSD